LLEDGVPVMEAVGGAVADAVPLSVLVCEAVADPLDVPLLVSVFDPDNVEVVDAVVEGVIVSEAVICKCCRITTNISCINGPYAFGGRLGVTCCLRLCHRSRQSGRDGATQSRGATGRR
jgi:hypothetical protein